jgi:hypothetical protein
MQGFVMNNPYFINFFLGCIKTVYSYLASNPAGGVKNLSEMKTYTEMLKCASAAINEDYPTKTDFQKKRKAFFRAYELPNLLEELMTAQKKTAYGYGMKYNGFRTWYEAEGNRLAEDPPIEAVRSETEVLAQPVAAPL